jgi:hypothetical protein
MVTQFSFGVPSAASLGRSCDFLSCDQHRNMCGRGQTKRHPSTSQHNVSQCLSIGTWMEARGWGTMLQAGRSRVRFLNRTLNFLINLTRPAALWPWGHNSNRNEYQESSWGVKSDRSVRLTTSPPSVSRLSRQNVGASTSHKPVGFHGLLTDSLIGTWMCPC